MMNENAFPNHSTRATMLVLPLTLAAVAGGIVLSLYPTELGLAVCLAAVIVIMCIKYTEVAFALFLTAGAYKADQRFAIPGVDITVLFGVVTALGILLAVYNRKITLDLPPKAMILPYMVVAWLASTSILYTIAPIYGADKLFRFLTITTLAFFAPFYIFQDRKRLGNFLRTIMFIASAMLLDIIYHNNALNMAGFVSAFGSDYLALGSISGLAFIIAFLYFFQKDPLWVKKAVYLIIGLGFVYATLISGGRGPVIALTITLVVILVVSLRSRKEGVRMSLWITAFLVFAFTAVLYNIQYFPILSARLSVLMHSGNLRYDLYDSALNAMGTFPYLLTGLGIGGFSVYYFRFDAISGGYPHNIFLELGCETGLFGLMAFCFLVFWAMRVALLKLRTASGDRYFEVVVCLAFLVFMLVNASKSGDINDNRLLFTAIGLTYAVTREEGNG